MNKGDLIGRIGHSGNSFFPHLHFQLMDSCDIATANGLSCAFEEYEIFQNGEWVILAILFFHICIFNLYRIRFQTINSETK